MMNIVWAYNTAADVPDNGNFAQHTSQGGLEYTFIQDTNGGGDGGNGSSSMYTPSIPGIMALFLFQRVMSA